MINRLVNYQRTIVFLSQKYRWCNTRKIVKHWYCILLREIIFSKILPLVSRISKQCLKNMMYHVSFFLFFRSILNWFLNFWIRRNVQLSSNCWTFFESRGLGSGGPVQWEKEQWPTRKRSNVFERGASNWIETRPCTQNRTVLLVHREHDPAIFYGDFSTDDARAAVLAELVPHE